MVVTYLPSLMTFTMKRITVSKANQMLFKELIQPEVLSPAPTQNKVLSVLPSPGPAAASTLCLFLASFVLRLHVPDQSSSSQILISFCTILALTWQLSDLAKLLSILNEDWKGRLGGVDVPALEISNSATYQVPEILTLPSHFSDSLICTCISKIVRFQIYKPPKLKNKFLLYLNNKSL